MALSGFIKQLLQTDSVFGSEAKKLTGINDSQTVLTQGLGVDYKPLNRGTEISITITPTLINVQLPQFGPALGEFFPIPNFIQAGLFLKISFGTFQFATQQNAPDDDASNEEARRRLTQINNSLLRITNVETFFDPNNIPTLSLDFDIAVGEGPLWVQLAELVGTSTFIDLLGPLEIRLDGRIASIINEQKVADIDSSGATRFNLDNNTAGQGRGASGIARKYAAHYHGSQQINLVTNTRDEQGFQLLRIERLRSAVSDSSIDFVYDPARAFEAATVDNTGSADIRITYNSDGRIETVAQYGYIGTNGFGSITINQTPTPRTTNTDGTVNRGTRVSFRAEEFEFGTASWPQVPRTDPQAPIAIHEQLRSLRDAMRLVINTNDYATNIISADTVFRQVLEIRAGRNTALNTNIVVFDGDLAPSQQIFETNVVGATSAEPVSGNEFITYADLLSVLQGVTDFGIAAEAGDTTDSIVLRSNTLPDKIVTFIAPTQFEDIWETPDGDLIFQTNFFDDFVPIVSPGELVFDNSGDVVFSNFIQSDC